MAYQRAPRDPRPTEHLERAPMPPIRGEVLNRYGAHVLDPEKAGTVRGRRVNPTAYVGHELLVQGSTDDTALEALVEAARSTGHGIASLSPARRRYVEELGEQALKELVSTVWVTKFRLEPDPVARTPAPDAWAVLQKYREMTGDGVPDVTVGLNHLVSLTALDGITGVPYVDGPGLGGSPYVDGPGLGGSPYVDGPALGGSPYVDGPGLSSYAVPGRGGRSPVTWLGKPPVPTQRATSVRRPVVAVLDTGLGEHDWLQPPFATQGARVNGHRIGLDGSVPDSELTGVVRDPLQGILDRDSGHGTFIAGIIRQTCPDARVLAIRVMPSDGVVDEHQLTIALNMLLVRQAQAQLTGTADEIIDVLSLSLGYYHETPEDVTYSSALSRTLASFGELGVVVVAAAGNDHTRTPMFPAGLASRSKGADQRLDAVPLVSVGALNPNGTVALFSNAGDWVTCHRPGAAVVSTLPVTFDGSLQAGVATSDGRESLDPDDYASGFGVWSGTSFAAPVLAGEIAQQLFESGSLKAIDAASAVERGWSAIEKEVGWSRP